MSDPIEQRRKELLEAIKRLAIVRDTDQAILSPKGVPTQWLLDLRQVMLNSKALNTITDSFWDHYQDQLPFQIGGMEVAAVPLVTALLLKAEERGLQTSGFVIRKERKPHGLAKLIEGLFTDDPIILVDDLINSGKSLEKARIVAEHEGGKVREVFVIVDYQTAGGLRWRQQHDLPVTSLFVLSEFDLEVSAPGAQPEIDYEIVWRFFAPGAFPFHVVPKSTPLLVGDRIYMGSDAGIMNCINAENGEVIWQFECAETQRKGIRSSPQIHEGRLYFGAYDGIVYCLDGQDGSLIWKNPACDWVGSTPLIVPKHNMLYIGLEYARPRQQGSNAALNLDDGQPVWESGLKKLQHGSGCYWEEDDLVIFGSSDHAVIAYNAKTGETVWETPTERSIKYAPAIDHKRKRVVSTSFDGNAYVMDVKTGEKLAAFPSGDLCYNTALITEDKIFTGSGDKHLYIIDADSLELLDKINYGGRIYSSPRLIDGNVVFGTNGGKILEMDPKTHEIVGRAQLPDAVTNAIASSPDGNMLYASTHMNELYAIKRNKV